MTEVKRSKRKNGPRIDKVNPPSACVATAQNGAEAAEVAMQSRVWRRERRPLQPAGRRAAAHRPRRERTRRRVHQVGFPVNVAVSCGRGVSGEAKESASRT